MKTSDNAAVTAGAIIFTVLLLFPILFDDWRSHNTVGEWWVAVVRGHETLWTGILAVAAAYITVKAMNNIDDKQASRHAQNVELIIRPSRLRMERAVFPQVNDFEECIVLGNKIIRRDRAIRGAAMGLQIGDVREFVRDISAILDRQQFKDGFELFNGRLTYEITTLKSELNSVGGIKKEIFDHYDREDERGPDEDDFYDEWVRETDGENELISFVARSTFCLEQLVPNLRLHGDLYEVNQDISRRMFD